MHVLHLPGLHTLRTALLVLLAVLLVVGAYAAGAELLPAADGPAAAVSEPRAASAPELTPAPILLPDGTGGPAAAR